MGDEMATDVRADITGASADGQEVHVAHGGASGLQAIGNGVTSGFHCAREIALVQLVRVFVTIGGATKIEMPVLDVAVQKNLPNPLTLISGSIEGLLLG